MRARLLPLLIAGALLATGVPASADHVTARPLTTACPANQVSSTPFADVAASSPFELAISCLSDEGITRGRTATSYAPASGVQRQQMAQFLYRLGGRGGVVWDSSDAGFGDLDSVSSEARTAINSLANAGIAQGRSAGVFDPGGAVTRGQMASFLARLADAAGADGFASTGNAFDDDEELVHEPSIDRIAAAGVTTGRGSDRFFDPLSAVTREQMAAFLARVLDRFVAQGLSSPPYREDVAPVAVTLDQQGRLIAAGSALTGRISGDRLRSASLTSPCAGTVEIGREFSVPTDPQSPVGRCPVTVSTTFDNGRTTTQSLFVVMPGYTERAELVHVERLAGSSTAEGTSEVRFVYDAPVTLPTFDSDRPLPFLLAEYGGERSAATGVRKSGDDEVVATFGSAEHPVGRSELLEVSYALSGRGAVLDLALRPGPLTTALLNPRSSSAQSYAGPTWQADLLSVSGGRPDPAITGNYLVDFLFDAPLPKKYPGDSGVDVDYVYDTVVTVGTGRRCEPQTPLPARRVTVSCNGSGDPDDPGGEIARGVVSIRSEAGEWPYAATLLPRRATVGPDLVEAQWGPSANQITYVFDEPVQAGAPDRFSTAGPHDPFFGTGHAVEVSSADPRRVVVTLSGNEIDKNTLASARGGAVTSRATGRLSVFAQVQVPARVAEVVPAGQSLGADLLELTVDADAVALYDFDTYFFPTEYSGQIEEDLRLYTPAGVELVCDGAGYDPRDRDPNGGFTGYSTNLVCGEYSADDGVGPVRPATDDEVRSAVHGVGAGVGRAVLGARR